MGRGVASFHRLVDTEGTDHAGMTEVRSASRSVTVAGQPIVLSSNDYLGLSHHPLVIAAASQALAQHGVGSTSSRSAARDSSVFEALEAGLADFKGFEATLVFQSGYVANVGMIQALVAEGDVIVRDENAHASTRDGALLSGATEFVYRHRDVGQLEDILARNRPRGGHQVVIATDGVFGMDGDIAPLPQICDLAERHGASVVVDDAHATGVLGREGRGTVDHFQLGSRVHIQVGTLSKALGAMGGFVGSPRTVRAHLLTSSHPTLYSTLPPVALAAACIAALAVMRSEPDRLQRLWANTAWLKAELATAGFATAGCETPILPIPVQSAEIAHRFAARLRELGVIVQAITRPTLVAGPPRLRLTVRSELSQAELRHCSDAMAQVGHELRALGD